MKYISPELSKEVYELTGLIDQSSDRCWKKIDEKWRLVALGAYEPYTDGMYPAYNFSFLFDHLPRYSDNGWDLVMHCNGEEAIELYYEGPKPTMRHHLVEAHDPTVGVALLLIDLHKTGKEVEK